ncbi:MAG: hypothetical protein ABIJ04_00795 [Bacteroidota bacterium]
MKSSQVREQQVPMESVYPMTITSEYTFIKTNFTYLFFSHIAYMAFHLVLGIGFFKIVNRHKVLGRKNLLPLKKQGFITVANHCHIFDTVLTGLSALPRRPWYASVQRNFEAPYFRKMFRILRGFPIPDGSIGLRRIIHPVVGAVKQGKIVHLFKPRKIFGKVRSKNILSITSVIGEPIYPRVQTEEGQRVDLESVQEMCDTAQNWMMARVAEYHR